MSAPVGDPTFESPPDDEAQAIADLVAFQLKLMNATNPTRRGQHAKGHASIRGDFAVLPGLPPELAVGVFREPKTFPVVARFSNGFAADDRIPDVHGMAIKLFGVPGDRLVGSAEQGHDFVLADHPVFFAPTVKRALDFFSSKVALDMQGIPPVEGLARLATDFPLEARLFPQFLSPPPSIPLDATYWSVTPSLLGPNAAKYLVQPRETVARRSNPIDSPDFLRLAMAEHLTHQPAAFDFRVQLRTDPTTMPIEDPTVEWSSPWTTVATLTIPPQALDGPGKDGGEALSFNPWRCLPEHRPLGGINRCRKVVYEASLKLRSER